MHLQNRVPIFLLVAAFISGSGAQEVPVTPQVPTANPPSNVTPGRIESPEDTHFVLQRNVDLVVLNATVVDQRGQRVTNLDRDDFTVFENGVQQTLTGFSREDIPVSLGILIDNSSSMSDKREAVNQVALDLVNQSNPYDQEFLVNFADKASIDQDFTSNIELLRKSLNRIHSEGGTALYDAVIASADYMVLKSTLDRQALLLITDGEDNSSDHSLEETTRRVQNDQGPVIYAIGLLGKERAHEARRALQTLAYQTGGVAFFPQDLSEVDEIATTVARDIRNQYTLQYKSTKPQEKGGYRAVKVVVTPKNHGQKLVVRTRSGYYPGQ